MPNTRNVRYLAAAMRSLLSRGIPVLLFAVEVTTSRAADVSWFLVAGKGETLNQTNSGPPVVLTNQPFAFTSSAIETVLGNVSSASVTIPGGGVRALFRDSLDPEFRTNESFVSQAAMDGVYTSGNYTQTIVTVHEGTKTIGLNLSGNNYPNDPHISNWTAAQSLIASADFTVTWDAFTSGTITDFVKLTIDDNQFKTGNFFGLPGALNGTNTFVVVPAGTLSPGTNYIARLLFAKAVSTNSAAYPGVPGVTAYFKETTFNISTLPLPSNVLYFDNFQEVPSGTVLNVPTYTYVPPVGASAEFIIGSGGSQVSASNLLGSVRAFFDNPIGSSGGEYYATPAGGPLTNQILDITWTLWIQSVKTPFSTNQFGIQIPATNQFGSFPDTRSFLLFFDSGIVGAITNLSPPSFATIGSWSNYVGTVMTNELVLNYPAHTFSFAINGTVLTNMPLWSGFTNIFTDVSFGPTETSSGAQGNQFALDNVKLSVVPTDFRITSIQVVGKTNTTIGFTTLLGALYQVQTNNDLVAGTWLTLTNNVRGTGGIVPVTDSFVPAQQRRFYRVRLLP